MIRISRIEEESERDLNLHYSGVLVYEPDIGYCSFREGMEGSVLLEDREGSMHRKDYNLEGVYNNIKAVNIDDGYIQKHNLCFLHRRRIDKSYRKALSLHNAETFHPDSRYLINSQFEVGEVKLPDYPDLAANSYLTYRDAIKALSRGEMASAAISQHACVSKSQSKPPYNIYYLKQIVGFATPTKTLIIEPELTEYFEELNVL